jgi:hypothetical protein
MYAETGVMKQSEPSNPRAYEGALSSLHVALGAIESLIARAEREFGPVLLSEVPQIGGNTGIPQVVPRESEVTMAIQGAASRAEAAGALLKALLDRAAV